MDFYFWCIEMKLNAYFVCRLFKGCIVKRFFPVLKKKIEVIASNINGRSHLAAMVTKKKKISTEFQWYWHKVEVVAYLWRKI